MLLVSSCSCLYPIRWSQVLSWEWRCSWSSADRRCSNYIWVINNLIAYKSASYIRDLTVIQNVSPCHDVMMINFTSPKYTSLYFFILLLPNFLPDRCPPLYTAPSEAGGLVLINQLRKPVLTPTEPIRHFRYNLLGHNISTLNPYKYSCHTYMAPKLGHITEPTDQLTTNYAQQDHWNFLDSYFMLSIICSDYKLFKTHWKME